MNESLPKSFSDKLTEKAQKLYDEAKLVFKEYLDNSLWTLDMLDNYYDFLLASDDEFLDMFDVSYNTETETDEESDSTHYSDPEITLTPKKPHKYEPLGILVVGYVLPRNDYYEGFGIQCYVNTDCREQGRLCVKLMKQLLSKNI